MKDFNKLYLIISLFLLAVMLALVVDLFYLLAVRIFVLLLFAVAAMFYSAKRMIPKLQTWLEEKLVMDLSKHPVPQKYIYQPIAGKSYLKDETAQLTSIDSQSLDRSRLSQAELNAIDKFFNQTLAAEILIRLKQLADGETKAVTRGNKIKHDLWGLAIINLIVLFGSFIITLYLVFGLRYVYQYIAHLFLP
ncbi:hypothetical protein [Candidatus Albibeggiatoa sp. nov. NOAA]|uniref:hypothetical protein n=1 Tax=Candidatus Albibeggiatoa sp. nov. NOAA TaxID=3162724 RepID=UPI0033025FA4|nr:hypothetical protein [Thiotrichaceae bacterium]